MASSYNAKEEDGHRPGAPGSVGNANRGRKPDNTAFKQQRLPAWQPILTAGTVLPAFFIIGLIFIPIGIGLFVTSNNIKEFEATSYYAEATSYYAEATSYYAEATSYYAEATSYYAEATSYYAEATSYYAEATSYYAEATSYYAEATSYYAEATSYYAEATSYYAEATSYYAEATSYYAEDNYEYIDYTGKDESSPCYNCLKNPSWNSTTPCTCTVNFSLEQPFELEHPHTVPADGAVGVEVEGHQAFWTCDNKPFILVLTTVPPHTDSLGVSTKTKAGLSNVFMYYGLSNFYQNHRRYVKSRDDSQLNGDLSSLTKPSKECEPYHTNDNKPIAPCGAIANSMFNDTLELFYIDPNGTRTMIPLMRKGIAWWTDKHVKFRNPGGSNANLTVVFKDTTKPINWHKPVYELDTDSENNGFINEDFIVWMRTAALPTFRKLYRIIQKKNNMTPTLPRGNYTLEVTYNYPVDSFDGSKRMILSTISWMGGKNPFLGIAYITVGSVCFFLGVVLLIIHHKYGNRNNSSDIPN
ncbi:hypothetical protein NFI96_020387 [Prochilodus magdalenae]|nr:hypothetical protein NFI96_020387 [Prochilodus magdalenae]